MHTTNKISQTVRLAGQLAKAAITQIQAVEYFLEGISKSIGGVVVS